MNDKKIWENFKDGDKSALSYIYFQNFHPMYQYGTKLKNDPDFIKDCIQEVFFTLIKAGKKLGATDNIRFYLFKALKNKIIRELSKSRSFEPVNESHLYFASQFSFEDKIIQIEKTTEKEKALANALTELSNRQREIIFLKYECDLEYDRISELLQINIDSARKLSYRAILKLKETIQSRMGSLILFLFSFPR